MTSSCSQTPHHSASSSPHSHPLTLHKSQSLSPLIVILVSCIYRPPDFGGFYDIFRPILERISVNRNNVIITGDFNSNMLDNSGNGKKFKDLLQLVGFSNIIKSPTRVTGNSSTVIDLICTRLFLRVLLTFASRITNSFIRHSSLSSHAIHSQLLKM